MSKEKREKRKAIYERMKEINDLAIKENRSLSADEQANWDKADADQEQLGKEIEREDRMAKLAIDLKQPINARGADGLGDASADPADAEPKSKEERMAKEAKAERRAAFQGWLAGGMGRLSEKEQRALQADVNVSGGYLVPPEEFVMDIIKTINDQVFLRGLATVRTIAKAASLGIPTRTARASDATWTQELTVGAKDTALLYGKRVMVPHKLSKEILISNQLLRNSPFGVEGEVKQEFEYIFGITEEKAFMTGSGAQQPLGIFTASNDGIPTTQDVSTGNTTTGVTFDGLIEALYNLKGFYQGRASWIGHRLLWKQVRKLKDGEGDYLWQMSTQAGQPDRLLNCPVYMSEFAPSTFTTGLYVAAIGDFSTYRIVDALQFEMQRLVELYAETAQTAFIGDKYTDGAPVLPEAITRVKLA